MVARRHTRQSVLVGSSSLYGLDGLRYHGVDLRVVLLHVALAQLEERPLGLLHQVVDVGGLVEGLCLYDTGKGDELAGKEFLGDDVGVILNVG